VKDSRRVFWVLAIFAILGAVACGTGDLLGPGAPQGIEGTVLLGPQCPVQTAEDPCPDLPFQAWIQVLELDGRPLARIRSGEDGTFRIGLRPGSYVLDPDSGDPFPHASPMEVTVQKGRFTSVIVHLDTGIR
jgi:hypothetical protein